MISLEETILYVWYGNICLGKVKTKNKIRLLNKINKRIKYLSDNNGTSNN